MIATPDIEQIIGAEAVDPNNDRIGKVSQVYVDADTDQPTWASVRTGLFGISETLVPLDNATWDHEQLHVTVVKARVKDAPRVDPDAEISPDEQERLYSYYGLAGEVGADRTDRGRVGGDADGYDATTMSETGYGAGAGAGAGLAGAGVGHVRERDASYGDGPAGPRYDRGQSREADENRVRTPNAGYGEVPDDPEGPDVRGSGRTAGDGRGSGDFASTGTALEHDNPVAEEAAEGTGNGYGTSDIEDISGRFYGDGGVSGDSGGHRHRAEPGEAGGADDRQMPGMAGGIAGAGADAGMGGGQVAQGDPAMQSSAAAMPQEATGVQEGSVGMQRQAGGGMRLRRYIIRQETVVVPLDEQDELRMQPGAASSTDDSSTGMRMDDQDPRDPGLR
jgi:hypothetical protein